MKILLQCLLFLSCNGLMFSAEILAWKTPIARIAVGGKASPRLERLEKPPEASPFFGKDDELWNVASIMPNNEEAAEKLEWAVWNATSGRLVAKGSWVALFELQRHYDLKNPPVQCRVKIDAYQVTADGAPLDASKKPTHSLSCIARSGQKTLAAYSESGASISLKCEPNLSEDFSLVDLWTVISVSLADGTTLKLDTSAALLNGSPLWIARTFDGKSGLDIMVTATAELVDGSPHAELVMIQEDNTTRPFPGDMRNHESGNIKIGDKYSLIWYPIPMYKLLSYLGMNGSPQDNKVDPSAAAGANDPDNMLLDQTKLKNISVPNAIAPHIQGPVFDVGDLFKATGIHIPKGDLIGYDYKKQRVFIYSSDVRELDKFQSLFMLLGDDYPKPFVFNVRDKGEMRLISRIGIKSSIEISNAKSKQTRSFQVESMFGEKDAYLDARFNYEYKIGDQTMNSIDSSATLETGKPLKISEKTKADGMNEAIEVKAEILKQKH